MVAETPKSKRSDGCAATQLRHPCECAFGTFITMRDEQLPARMTRLQVVDLGAVRGNVELRAPVREADLRSKLVVRQFLVPECRPIAEGHHVLRRAERQVQRVVDAAEPEAAGYLRVQLDILVDVV